jgi:hypothetical protein
VAAGSLHLAADLLDSSLCNDEFTSFIVDEAEEAEEFDDATRS